ncbi:hypothetical protein JG688_00016330 [Phytophthora aleatoria]|uniref:Uncharacterized protein n=1 Tax=Phytophthora aleatoria TaxID=2496075 RepID=A0A8J5I4D9_9STRA|nr:hypothetical protein JG688_00016330 [Phytophthora aleatoria]
MTLPCCARATCWVTSSSIKIFLKGMLSMVTLHTVYPVTLYRVFVGQVRQRERRCSTEQ